MGESTVAWLLWLLGMSALVILLLVLDVGPVTFTMTLLAAGTAVRAIRSHLEQKGRDHG